MIKNEALLFLTSFSHSYKNLIIALAVGNETLKVEEVITVILYDQKFKKINGINEGRVFIINSSCRRSNSCGNNSRSRLSLRQ